MATTPFNWQNIPEAVLEDLGPPRRKPPTPPTKPAKCGCGSGREVLKHPYDRPSTLCIQCKARCGCWTKFRCKGCRYCVDCGCQCRRCTSCNTKHYIVACPSCGVCKKSCTCRQQPKALRLDPPTLKPTECLINTLPRAMGVELEIGELGTLADQPAIPGINYKFVRDGSVKPSEQEMVIDPLAGDAFVRGMVRLSSACYAAEARTNLTCGLHVHVNARDFSYWHLKRLLKLWSRIEGDVYGFMVDPDRRTAQQGGHDWHYCRPLMGPFLNKLMPKLDRATRTAEIKDAIVESLYGYNTLQRIGVGWTNALNEGTSQTILHKKKYKYESCRYFGLNLHAWMQRGTIEYRHKEGTFDVVELVCWPIMCGWITQLATKLSTKEIESLAGLRDLASNHMPKLVAQYVESRYTKTPLIKELEL
jgi:hypothetical protein